MAQYLSLLLSLISILLPATSYSSSNRIILNEISSFCENHQVILLGEQHQQPDSQKLFLALVQHYVQQGSTVFVGLEIPTDKQGELNAALSGENNFSFISTNIIHPAYQDMVHALGKLKSTVTVQAIDARDEEENRDIAMSRKIMSALSTRNYDKIFVLVGNLHVIKKIMWHEDLKIAHKYLANNLIDSGVTLCSIQQIFKKADGEAVLIQTKTGRGASLAMEVISPVNHSDTMTGTDVCDAVIEWK